MEHLNAVRDLLGNAWKVHLEGSTILTAAGAAAVTYLSYSLFKKVVWTPFKLYALAQVLPGVDLKKQGEWAVITGATDGLGKLELEPIMHCLTRELQRTPWSDNACKDAPQIFLFNTTIQWQRS